MNIKDIRRSINSIRLIKRYSNVLNNTFCMDIVNIIMLYMGTIQGFNDDIYTQNYHILIASKNVHIWRFSYNFYFNLLELDKDTYISLITVLENDYNKIENNKAIIQIFVNYIDIFYNEKMNDLYYKKNVINRFMNEIGSQTIEYINTSSEYYIIGFNDKNANLITYKQYIDKNYYSAILSEQDNIIVELNMKISPTFIKRVNEYLNTDLNKK